MYLLTNYVCPNVTSILSSLTTLFTVDILSIKMHGVYTVMLVHKKYIINQLNNY